MSIDMTLLVNYNGENITTSEKRQIEYVECKHMQQLEEELISILGISNNINSRGVKFNEW